MRFLLSGLFLSLFLFCVVPSSGMVIPLSPENHAIIEMDHVSFDWYDSDSLQTNHYLIRWTTNNFSYAKTISGATALGLNVWQLNFPRGVSIAWKVAAIIGQDTVWGQSFHIHLQCIPEPVHLISPFDGSIVSQSTIAFAFSESVCHSFLSLGIVFSTGRVLTNVSSSFDLDTAGFPRDTWITWRVFVTNGIDTAWSYETRQFRVLDPCTPQAVDLIFPVSRWEVCVSETNVNFSWSDAGCNTQFLQGIVFSTGKIVVGTQTSLVVSLSSFPLNEWIAWKVFVTDGFDTAWSRQVWQFKVLPDCVPQSVHLISPIDNFVATDSVQVFSWTQEPCNEQFQIGVWFSSGKIIFVTGKTSLSLALSSFEKGKWIAWCVFVTNGKDTACSYETRNFRTLRAFENQSFHLISPDSATIYPRMDVTLSFCWTRVWENNVHYGIVFSIDQTDYFGPIISDTSLQYPIWNVFWPLENGKKIFWKVYATNGVDTLWSEEKDWWFLFQTQTSVFEDFSSAFTLVKVSEDVLELRSFLPLLEKARVSLFDFFGREISVIYEGSLSNSLFLDVSRFSSGTYFFVVSSSQGIRSLSFVLLR